MHYHLAQRLLDLAVQTATDLNCFRGTDGQLLWELIQSDAEAVGLEFESSLEDMLFESRLMSTVRSREKSEGENGWDIAAGCVDELSNERFESCYGCPEVSADRDPQYASFI